VGVCVLEGAVGPTCLQSEGVLAGAYTSQGECMLEVESHSLQTEGHVGACHSSQTPH